MSGRGYMLVDFTCSTHLYPDQDLVVRFTEYVRQNIHSLVPGLPETTEPDLMASGHAHNPGLLPLLGLYFPPQVPESAIPEFQFVIRTVDEWCASLSENEARQIALMTEAPTWEELIRMGRHPFRMEE